MVHSISNLTRHNNTPFGFGVQFSKTTSDMGYVRVRVGHFVINLLVTTCPYHLCLLISLPHWEHAILCLLDMSLEV